MTPDFKHRIAEAWDTILHGQFLTHDCANVTHQICRDCSIKQLERFRQEAYTSGRRDAYLDAENYLSDFDNYKACQVSGHDLRWCSHCESVNDAADLFSGVFKNKAAECKSAKEVK